MPTKRKAAYVLAGGIWSRRRVYMLLSCIVYMLFIIYLYCQDLVLFKLKSTRIELIIGSLLAKQFIMGSALDDSSVVKYHDGV